jgi:methylmalonyl-CoA/ethylmalonyl-CoA epimerase
MLKRVHHIGIAVHDLDAAIRLYRDKFGVEAWERISLPERHMDVAVCRVGDTLLEFITPTSDQAAFAAFLRDRGEGVHHLAYEVDDVETTLRTVEGNGIRLIDAHGRPGIHDTCVAFLHPKATMGVLIELVEPSHSHAKENTHDQQ